MQNDFKFDKTSCLAKITRTTEKRFVHSNTKLIPVHSYSTLIMAARPLDPIECSVQPLDLAFHPSKEILAVALIDGTVECKLIILSHENLQGSSPFCNVNTCEFTFRCLLHPI